MNGHRQARGVDADATAFWRSPGRVAPHQCGYNVNLYIFYDRRLVARFFRAPALMVCGRASTSCLIGAGLLATALADASPQV